LEEIVSLLQKSFLTKNLNLDQIKKTAGAMMPRKFKQNQAIITYGDMGNEYFVLAKGSVRVYVY
jgi:CRP-like cAMP-binding protein